MMTSFLATKIVAMKESSDIERFGSDSNNEIDIIDKANIGL